MKSYAPHRTAVIGCGDIARTGHVPAIIAHPSFHLVALCDIDESRAASLAAHYSIAAVTTDYRRLLTATDIDAAISIGTIGSTWRKSGES